MFCFSKAVRGKINAISIYALISSGPEDTGCPSLSLRLQPLLGIWGHHLPLCCPTGSTVHCSLPAFTGFPVSGYHVLCLFSLLFVRIHPIGFFIHQTVQIRGWHYLNFSEEVFHGDDCVFISRRIYLCLLEGFWLVSLWPYIWHSFQHPSLSSLWKRLFPQLN